MLKIRPILFSLLLAGTAQAGAVYRCEGDAGLVFQDVPCAPRQKQRIVHLAPEPASAPAPDHEADDRNDAPPPPQPANAPAAPQPAPQPSFFLCTAQDGSRYTNDSSVGMTHWVPYSMLDDRQRSLAEVYGGHDGLATHPPGAANIPHRPAAPGSGAGYYVEVVDPCHRAGAGEACAYLHGQLDDLDGKLRRAFSDTEARLKQERARVVEQLRGCR